MGQAQAYTILHSNRAVKYISVLQHSIKCIRYTTV